MKKILSNRFIIVPLLASTAGLIIAILFNPVTNLVCLTTGYEET